MYSPCFRAGLLAGVTVAAFSATAVLAVPPAINSPHTGAVHRISHAAGDRSLSVLYDQTSNDSGGATASQNFGNTWSSAAADDFTVPDGVRWAINEVDAIGPFFNGVATSVQVTIYTNKHHRPNKTVYDAAITPSGNDSGEFVLDLGKRGVTLKPGHYWLSVVANAALNDGQWYWENQTFGTTEGDPAVWENPDNGLGTGCTSWTPENECTLGPAGDQMFVLKGRVK